MVYDVYLFKVNEERLANKIADKESFEIPFTRYVEHKNLKQQRTESRV